MFLKIYIEQQCMSNLSKIYFRSYQNLLKSILESCYDNKPKIKVQFLMKAKNYNLFF